MENPNDPEKLEDGCQDPPTSTQNDSAVSNQAWLADKENPRNWSYGKKMYHTSITAIYAFTM